MTILLANLSTQYLNLNVLGQALTLSWSGRGNLFGRHIRLECVFGVAMWSAVGTIVKRRERGWNPPAYRIVYASSGMEKYYT